MKDSREYTDLVIIRRLLRQVQPYWLHIVAIFLLGLLEAPLALLTPLPLKIAVDNVLGDGAPSDFLQRWLSQSFAESPESILALAAILMIVVALLTQLQTLGSTLLRTYTGEKLSLDFRTTLFRHVQQLSLGFHDTTGTAESVYSIQYDTEAIRYLAIDGITPFISASFTFLAMLLVMFRIDWKLALVALAISPILFMVARTYRLNLRQQSRQVRHLESGALSIVQEVLTSLRVVKAFGQEEREQARFELQSDKGLRARLRLETSQGLVSFILSLTTAVGTALILFIGVRDVQNGTITLGELLLIMGYLAQLYAPLKTISRKITSLQSHLARIERAFTLLDTPPGVPEDPDGRPIKRARGDLTVKNVSFAYQDGQTVLQDISLAVESGTRVGIAGKTGAGKTTLVGLLTRFYDPDCGQILLDGVDLCHYKLSDLREQFAIVLQETVLFSTTIAENIAYARPEASMDEITEAARAANAHDFIMNLPDGYETQVGERGMLLSGGERQRIALARAFLKDAPILILDEPTSSVDIKTESDILEAMERLMRHRTTFMIAHRLSTLLNCDLLLTMQDGRLASLSQNVPKALRHALDTDDVENAWPERQNAVRMAKLAKTVDSLSQYELVDGKKKRGRPLVIEWRDSAQELENRYRQEKDERLQTRIHAFVLIRRGHSLTEVSESLPVGYRTLQRWVTWYRSGGLEEVLKHASNQVGNGSRSSDMTESELHSSHHDHN